MNVTERIVKTMVQNEFFLRVRGILNTVQVPASKLLTCSVGWPHIVFPILRGEYGPSVVQADRPHQQRTGKNQICVYQSNKVENEITNQLCVSSFDIFAGVVETKIGRSIGSSYFHRAMFYRLKYSRKKRQKKLRRCGWMIRPRAYGHAGPPGTVMSLSSLALEISFKRTTPARSSTNVP